jgi:hypothetical protein
MQPARSSAESAATAYGEMRGADPAFEFAGGMAEVVTDGEIFGARPRRDELGGGGVSDGDMTTLAFGDSVSGTFILAGGSSAAFATGAAVCATADAGG